MSEEILVAFDQDFDASPAKTSDVFSCLGPRRAFLIGLATSLLTLMSIGFVILSSLILSGKSISL